MADSASGRHLVVDARGLSCPEPAIMAADAIKTATPGTVVEVLVDTATSRNNVILAARQKGWQGDFEEDAEGTFRVTLTR